MCNDKTVASYLTALNNAKLLDPANFQFRRTIPRKKGIFVWYEKVSEKAVFVGRATGGKGIFGRVVDQQLNERYLDFKAELWNSERDSFQIENPVKFKGEPGIDKCPLRKALAREFDLRPGAASAKFLRENYRVAFIVVDDCDRETIETICDEVKKELKPLYC